MSKFVMIEHSLRSVGGHYFEYARGISEAAQALGFEPVVAVGRELEDTSCFPKHWRVHPVFERQRSAWYQAPRYPLRRLSRSLRGAATATGKLGAAGRVLAEEAKARHDQLRTWRGRHAAIEAYAEGCRELFQRENLAPGDVVFCSTCEDLNLLGLARFLDESPEAREAIWHLQFHFRVFTGRDPDYPEQEQHTRELRRRIRNITASPRTRFHFYATTEELARQYTAVIGAQVTPLAWPVAEGFTPHGSATTRRPLRLLIPGALRREKGKRLVTPLLQKLDRAPELRDAVQLLVQTTPKKGRKLLKDVADDVTYIDHLDLENLPSSRVVGLPHPLGSQDYSKLMRGVDIGLLPYDPDEYFGRASGPLCELLATGTPAIVPGGSWLSNQLESAEQAYCAELSTLAPQRLWQIENLRSQGERWQLDLPEHPGGKSDLLVAVKTRGLNGTGHYLRARLVQLGVNRDPLAAQHTVLGVCDGSWVRFVVPLHPGVRSLQLRFHQAFKGIPVRMEAITLGLLPGTENHRPQGKLGRIVDSEGDLPQHILFALSDMVSNYDHYRAAALAFSPRWRAQHCAARTVELLAQRSAVVATGVANSR